MSQKNFCVSFTKTACRISKNGKELLKMKASILQLSITRDTVLSTISAEIWHHRLNHVPMNRIKNVLNLKGNIETFEKINCYGCLLGGLRRSPISSKNKTYLPFQKLVMDTMGPFPQSVNHKKGVLLITDAGSGFIWCYPYFKRSEIPSYIIQTVNLVLTQHHNKLKILKADGAKEFFCQKIQNFIKEKGLLFELSSPYLHESNARAEVSNRIILYSMRCLLKTAMMSKGYWAYAILAAVYQYNMLPKIGQNHSPFQMFYNFAPPLHRLTLFKLL